MQPSEQRVAEVRPYSAQTAAAARLQAMLQVEAVRLRVERSEAVPQAAVELAYSEAATAN